MNYHLTTRLKLALCCVLGIFVAMSVHFYITNQQKKIQSHYSMGKALRARRYIAPGKLLTDDVIEDVAVPIAYIQPNAFKSMSELKNSKGDFCFKSEGGILKGEQVTKSRVYDTDRLLGLSWILESGQKAYSLKFDSEKAVAGLIQPGDMVSVLCAMDSQPGWDQPSVETLVSIARVIAVNDRVWNSHESLLKIKDGGGTGEQIIITLALTLREALVVAMGEERGKISLALCSSLDSDMLKTEFVQLSQLKLQRQIQRRPE